MAQLAEADVQRAIEAIAARLLKDGDRLAGEIVERYATVVPEYRALPAQVLHEDVAAVTLANLRWFLEHVTTPDDLTEYAAEISRPGLARRARQGVSLEAALKVVRLFGRLLWAAILEAAQPGDGVEREAALRMAGRLMEYVDGFCSLAEELWLEQARGAWSEQEVAVRDLIELLIAGRAASDTAQRQAGHLGVRLASDYVALVARGSEKSDVLRAAVRLVRDHLRPREPGTIVVMRHGEVVALHPVGGFDDVDALKAQCGPLAEELAEAGAKLGLGGWHPGPSGVPVSYDEARRAAIHALRSERAPNLVAFDDLVLDQLLQLGPNAHPHLETTLRRLREHDSRSRSDLVETLRAYIRSGFSLARSATGLHVHANTVVYRLNRIKEVTGRDPRDPDDLVILTLALKLDDLTPGM
jgi:sugar diacid utilization regulator